MFRYKTAEKQEGRLERRVKELALGWRREIKGHIGILFNTRTTVKGTVTR